MIIFPSHSSRAAEIPLLHNLRTNQYQALYTK